MAFDLVLIAILEGITEFLPVSSTAHIIILSKLLDLDTTSAYIKFYLLFIQFGALSAGLFLFTRKLLTDKKLLLNVFVSFLPSAAIGFILYSLFKKLLEGNMILLASMLAIGGVIFIYLEKVFMKNKVGDKARDNPGDNLQDFGVEEISTKQAFMVGIAQAVAIIPGVSRSGATIVAGILLGIKKATIIEYTFLLALPTIGAAVLYDAYKSREILSVLTSWNELAFGFIIATVVAATTLTIVKKYLSKISLTAFGWYRIFLAIAVLLLYV